MVCVIVVKPTPGWSITARRVLGRHHSFWWRETLRVAAIHLACWPGFVTAACARQTAPWRFHRPQISLFQHRATVTISLQILCWGLFLAVCRRFQSRLSGGQHWRLSVFHQPVLLHHPCWVILLICPLY